MFSCMCRQGYGFLSENATFVDICADHGIEFIGPEADHIRTMGDKSTARDTMKVLIPLGQHLDPRERDWLPDAYLRVCKGSAGWQAAHIPPVSVLVQAHHQLQPALLPSATALVCGLFI